MISKMQSDLKFNKRLELLFWNINLFCSIAVLSPNENYNCLTIIGSGEAIKNFNYKKNSLFED